MKTDEILKSTIGNLNTYFSADRIQSDEDLFAAGALDSLLLIQFVIAIEEKFKIRIKNDHITYDNFKTINAMMAFLNQHYLK